MLTDDLCTLRILQSVAHQREAINNILNVKLQKRTQVNTEAPYMYMVIHCPNYAQRVPNVSPGLIFWGLIFGRIFELVYRGLIFGGAYILGLR